MAYYAFRPSNGAPESWPRVAERWRIESQNTGCIWAVLCASEASTLSGKLGLPRGSRAVTEDWVLSQYAVSLPSTAPASLCGLPCRERCWGQEPPTAPCGPQDSIYTRTFSGVLTLVSWLMLLPLSGMPFPLLTSVQAF